MGQHVGMVGGIQQGIAALRTVTSHDFQYDTMPSHHRHHRRQPRPSLRTVSMRGPSPVHSTVARALPA